MSSALPIRDPGEPGTRRIARHEGTRLEGGAGLTAVRPSPLPHAVWGLRSSRQLKRRSRILSCGDRSASVAHDCGGGGGGNDHRPKCSDADCSRGNVRELFRHGSVLVVESGTMPVIRSCTVSVHQEWRTLGDSEISGRTGLRPHPQYRAIHAACVQHSRNDPVSLHTAVDEEMESTFPQGVLYPGAQ